MEITFTPVQAGANFLGWANKTSRNRLSAGLYPFPVRDIGGCKRVLLSDVLAVLQTAPVVAGPDPQAAVQPALAEEPARLVRRGAPTADERARARRAGLTVKQYRQQQRGIQHVAR